MISLQNDLAFTTITQEIIVITIKPGTQSICWSSTSNNRAKFLNALNDHLKNVNSIKQFRKKKPKKLIKLNIKLIWFLSGILIKLVWWYPIYMHFM